MEYHGLSADEARTFADRWLPAWTGNRPALLVSFYTDDAFYSDPSVPDGLRGRDALFAYFTSLLRHFPDWVWTQRGSLPLTDGFLNAWHASIPVGNRVVEIDGVCTVQMRAGRIFSNEVFFDRSELLAAIARHRGLG